MTDATPTPRVRRASIRPVPVWAWALIGVLVLTIAGLGAYLASGALANVPDVVGRRSDEAERALVAAGFVRGRITKVETSAPSGQVLAQDPAPGGVGRKGDAVALTVASPLTARVPALRGGDTAAARSAVGAVGLALSVHESYDASAATGTVMAQVPAAGTTVARGAIVAVLVSRGPRPPSARVPALAGRTRDAAVALLAKAGFQPVAHDGSSAAVASGTVIAQLPGPGAITAPGSAVHLLVSRGAATSTVGVPNVARVARKDAVAALASAGLTAKVEQAPSTTVATGAVIAQLPAAGSRVLKGADAVILVSSGAGTGEMPAPDVVGRTSASAQTALEPLGLVFTSVSSVSLDVPAGNVIAQLPLPGSPLTPGSWVICVVSTGRPR